MPLEKLGEELAAEEGYFALEEIGMLQEGGVRTVISDPHAAKLLVPPLPRRRLPQETPAFDELGC